MDLFRIGFMRFGLVDLIDVSVVAFIFYKLLSLMKGTRSAQIATGLVLVFVISFLAFWFQLDAVMWMFTNLATVGFIVLVVVFQPELRSALAQIAIRVSSASFLISKNSARSTKSSKPPAGYPNSSMVD